MPSGRVSATGRDGGLLPAAVPAAEAHDPLTPPDINIRTHDSQVERGLHGRGSRHRVSRPLHRGPVARIRRQAVAAKGGRVHLPRGDAASADLSAPGEVLVESEEAAETYSLAMAKKWIDDQ